MQAIRYIQENIDPLKLLQYYNFKEIVDTETEIRCCCAIHGGDNPTSFCWKKDNNLWFCHSHECGGGDCFTLVEKIEGLNFIQSVNKVAEILSLDIKDMVIEETDRILKEHEFWLNKNLKKNKEFKKYDIPFTKYTDTLESFTRFDEDIISFYKSKFCKVYPLENSLLYNKLVIPLYFNKVIVGVALRATNDFKPKWFYQPTGLELGNTLYNYDLAKQTIMTQELHEIILVEGIFDVWAYHRIGIDNVVAVYGSSITKEQKALILKLGVDIVTSFDNDNAGNKATAQVFREFKYIAIVKKVNIKENNDPASLKEEELLLAYEQRE